MTIVDSHAHVSVPIETYIHILDEAGIDRAILFATSIHPEKARDVDGFAAEMGKLNRVVLTGTTAAEARAESNKELIETIGLFPGRFCGFCSVPVGLSHEDTARWLESYPGCVGIGEVTMPPGVAADSLPNILAVASDFGNLPVWVHTFAPLGIADIRELLGLASRYPSVPLILGHAGGLNWLETIELARARENVYLDLSATFTRFAPLLAVRELPDRVLFGSDYPYGDPYALKVGLERVIPDKTTQERVMGENILSILGRSE
jgi:predicted TIM-barrel fold metal-dependent hydrolase